jgi:hypothetical protein
VAVQRHLLAKTVKRCGVRRRQACELAPAPIALPLKDKRCAGRVPDIVRAGRPNQSQVVIDCDIAPKALAELAVGGEDCGRVCPQAVGITLVDVDAAGVLLGAVGRAGADEHNLAIRGNVVSIAVELTRVGGINLGRAQPFA